MGAKHPCKYMGRMKFATNLTQNKNKDMYVICTCTIDEMYL